MCCCGPWSGPRGSVSTCTMLHASRAYCLGREVGLQTIHNPKQAGHDAHLQCNTHMYMHAHPISSCCQQQVKPFFQLPVSPLRTTFCVYHYISNHAAHHADRQVWLQRPGPQAPCGISSECCCATPRGAHHPCRCSGCRGCARHGQAYHHELVALGSSVCTCSIPGWSVFALLRAPQVCSNSIVQHCNFIEVVAASSSNVQCCGSHRSSYQHRQQHLVDCTV